MGEEEEREVGYGCETRLDTFQVTRLTFTIEIMMMLFQEVYHRRVCLLLAQEICIRLSCKTDLNMMFR